MNIIEKIEKEQLEKLSSGKQIPDFNPGDTIKVDVKVVEGTRERIQAFEGVCIARGGKGINESFTVRKISYGEGVERVFPLFSPKIPSITLVRKGKVRRAKLYYLRDRRGKAARIVEKIEVKKKTNEKKDVASVSKDKVEPSVFKNLPLLPDCEGKISVASTSPCAVIRSSIRSPIAYALAVVPSWARVTVRTSDDLAVHLTISRLFEASISVA